MMRSSDLFRPDGPPVARGPALFSSFRLLLYSSALLCASAVSFSLLCPASAADPAPQSSAPQVAGKTKKKSSTSRPRRQLAPDPARIREIQQALAREGFYEGDPTGKWDDSSVTAMKNFQQANGLQPTGKIEALALQKLGLGSPVAGLAPPAPQSPTTPSPSPNPAQRP